MIEDKSMGIKWAETEGEAVWYRTVEEIEQGIEMQKARMRRAEADLKIPDRKLVLKFKSGARQVIKEIKEVITVQEEILKFAKSKIKEPVKA